ncbi:MAG: polyhydroxyalkanoate synthesis regulator DNA-binding domain-containing protein [Candidatus Ozemobacteraceae bacterium]
MVVNPFISGPETVLRKYPNRRLYDPTRNTHVTLAEIADRVKNGEQIRVIDHQSGDDLTQVIMGQVLFETLKSRPDYLPLDLILLMIRARDNLIRDFLQHGLPQAYQMYMETQRRMMSGMAWNTQGAFPSLPNFTGVFPNPFQQNPSGMGMNPPELPAPMNMPNSAAGSSGANMPGATEGSRLQDEMDNMRREIDELKKQSKKREPQEKKGRSSSNTSKK